MLWRLAIITLLLKSDSQVLGDVTEASVDGAAVLCQAKAPSQSDSIKRTSPKTCFSVGLGEKAGVISVFFQPECSFKPARWTFDSSANAFKAIIPGVYVAENTKRHFL